MDDLLDAKLFTVIDYGLKTNTRINWLGPASADIRNFIRHYGSKRLAELYDQQGQAPFHLWLKATSYLPLGPLHLEFKKAWVAKGLASKVVEDRDAAIAACDYWGDAELLFLLQKHEEPVGWLKQAAEKVLKSFGRQSMPMGGEKHD